MMSSSSPSIAGAHTYPNPVPTGTVLPALVAIRGAITVKTDTPEAIFQAIQHLLTTLQVENGITQPETQLLQAFFSVTPDLTSVSVAKAARMQMHGWDKVAMMCFQEAEVEGLPPRCVRILLNAHGASLPQGWCMQPVYLEGASVLRPDWPPSS
ncbi:MAG: chorismate mutase [Vampirovibrionales bacterium]